MIRFFEEVRKSLLGGLVMKIGETELSPSRFIEDADGITGCYDITDGVSLTVSAKIGEDTAVFYLDAKCEAGFAPKNAITAELGGIKPDALLGSHHNHECFLYPTFINDYSELKPKTQSLFVKVGDSHYHMLPLCGDNFRCEFEEGKLRISSGKSGLTSLTGEFLAVAKADDPFKAVDKSYSFARKVGAVRVPLIGDREYPEMFEGLGWCTWDAFYNNVTSDGIYQKLDELKEKGIDLGWMIIDDGWLSIDEMRLTSFEARTQFPEGLKACISKIKNEYGVKYVGVWHAFHGYWEGIHHDSELAKQYADVLEKMNVPTSKPPYLVPALDADRAEKFWNAWYEYLSDCGVDFVKVDDQSASTRFYGEMMPTAQACRRAHEGIERAAKKYLNGVILNCMGMDMENVLARPYTAVSRNSDDFFPNKDRSFIAHLTQNVYNAVWHSKMYYCDFDMWWSGLPESAVQSGVLRAISGSPVYVSDKVGESIAANISPIVEDGNILRCDYAARPTYDCFYTDCYASGKHLKIWNRSGESFGVAAFNVGDGELYDSMDFGEVPEMWNAECEYMSYEYFTKKFTRVNKNTSVSVTLERDGCAVWSLYPIKNDANGEYIMLGDVSKYVPIASKKKVKTYLNNLA